MSARSILGFSAWPAFIVAGLLFDSCTTLSTITLRQDGSAFVHVYNVPVDRRTYYNRAIILDVDTAVSGNVWFVISDIDSLGPYLPWLRFESLRFRQVGDLLTIRSVPGEPRHACGSGWTRARANVFVEQGIGSITFNGVSANREDQWVLINRPKRKAKKKKPVDVAIELVAHE